MEEARRIVRQLNMTGLPGGRELIRIQPEVAVGATGKVGKVSYLVMRPELARIVRSLAKAADAPTE